MTTETRRADGAEPKPAETPEDRVAASTEAVHLALQGRTAPRERNRVLAVMLASVAAAVFAIVMTLALLFHYVEAHHLLAHL
jgi:hypothetical protein